MSKLFYKIWAFTLTEVLAVIAISGVVVSLGFMVLNLLSKNVSSISGNYSFATKTQLFSQQLALDFNRYPKITYSEFENKLTFSSALDSVAYRFDETVVLHGIDSLFVTVSQKKVYFRGERVNKGSVDGMELTLEENKVKKKLFVYRRNDGVTLLSNGN